MSEDPALFDGNFEHFHLSRAASPLNSQFACERSLREIFHGLHVSKRALQYQPK
jgi:hypothetical protein